MIYPQVVVDKQSSAGGPTTQNAVALELDSSRFCGLETIHLSRRERMPTKRINFLLRCCNLASAETGAVVVRFVSGERPISRRNNAVLKINFDALARPSFRVTKPAVS